jgi:hypothetical protein
MIIHQPRVAWDAARTFVAISESEAGFAWLSGEVRDLLGPAYQEALAGTRRNLLRPVRADAREVEAGTWRVRLEDVLRNRPSLAEPLLTLLAGAAAWPHAARPRR